MIDIWEAAMAHFEGRAGYASPGELAAAYDRRTVETPALELIDEALRELRATPNGRLIITMPPQEGKSSRCSHWFPAHVLIEDPDCRIVMASYADTLARRNSRLVRDTFRSNPELGLDVRDDVSAQAEWQIADHLGGVYATGIGGGLTGRPADLAIIDDPVKDREEADSETYRERVWSWYTDVLASRLAPGAQVLLIMTRWHQDDLAGRLIAEDDYDWKLLNIPAECVDPDDDPLGRELGEFMISAREGRDWELRKREAGAQGWASLYQGNPRPSGGTIFSDERVQHWPADLVKLTRHGEHVILHQGVTMCQSWDFTFKGKEASKTKKGPDYVVGQVWARMGSSFLLLDQVRGQWGFSVSVEMIKALSIKWPQATAKYVEDKANGSAVLDALADVIPGLIGVEPEGGKLSRANAVVPLWDAGNVLLPPHEGNGWVKGYIDELTIFPQGRNDDQVDASTQALVKLMGKRTATSQGTIKLW